MTSILRYTILCLFFNCSVFQFLFGQQISFEKTYGKASNPLGNDSDIGFSVKESNDSSFIVAGYTIDSIKGYGGYILKLNSLGDTIWTNSYHSDSATNSFNDIIQATNNEYIAVGRSSGITVGNVLIIKTDSMGNEIWQKNYGGIDEEEAYKILQISKEEYLIMGYTQSFGAGSYDIYFLMINNNGDTLWTKTIGWSNSYEIAFDIQPKKDGNYVIAAFKDTFPLGDPDVLFIEIDSSANILNNKIFHTDSIYTQGFSICPTSDGGYIIGGLLTYNFGSYDEYAYVLKIDSTLNKKWEAIYGYPSLPKDMVLAINELLEGGYVMYVWLNYKSVIMKIDELGDSLWSVTLSGYSSDARSTPMTSTDEGGIMLTGYKTVSGKDEEVYLAKIDSVGYVYSCKNNLVVNFNANNVSVGDTVFFIDSSTTKASSYLTNWQWNFGDGKTDSIQNPYHIYVYPDTLSVSLYIKNNTHCEDSLTKDIIISCAKPTAGFNADTTIIQIGDTVRFTELSVSSPYDTLVSRLWDFGDGATDTLQNPVHVYSTTNAFTVQLIVTTNYGCTDTSIKEKHIVVECPLITAGFAAETTLVKIGQPIKFTDLSTVQRDTITNWLWNFGDGATDTVQNPIHKYSAIDTFTVQLIITSNWGCSDTLDMIDYIMVKDTVDGIQTVKEEKASLNVFPNPFTNSTIIQYSLTGAIDNAVLTIYNIAGQEVFIRQIETQAGEFEISSTQLAAGTYYIKLKVGDKMIISDRKLVFVR